MSKEAVLQVNNVSKQYRLGQVGTGTISHDLNRFISRIRGKEDPFLKVGEKNVRSNASSGEYVWALDDISFELKQGDVLGIIGKNGSGKSTLLKILSRITNPTKGSINIKGRISSLLEVGTGFHPELTGLENIYLNGAILGMSKSEISSKLDEIVEFSGCAAYLNTPVKRYSSGMVVRLGFAVAAHLESEILIVDEVLAVGDQEFQTKCIGKMQDVSTSGRTILFVSHNMQSIRNLCKTGLWIDEGSTAYYGEIGETISNYLKSGENQDHFSIDLRNFKGRLGTGDIQFEHVEVYTNGEPSNIVTIGDEVKFRIKIKSHRKVFFKVSMHIFRFDDTSISNLENGDGKFHFTPFIGEKTFEINIGKVMLFPDSYKISLWMGEPTKEGVYDYCRYCCQIKVVEGSVIVQRVLPKNSGVIYVDSKWAEA
jgi:lipopolysaccharide transport system ATP-binding protein